MTATVSSHTLNAVDGTHAGGIAVILSRLQADGDREIIFSSQTGEDGRLIERVNLGGHDQDIVFELVFATGPYWDSRNIPRTEPQISREIVVRFSMPDPEARYHIPVIISPNNYSIWWSS